MNAKSAKLIRRFALAANTNERLIKRTYLQTKRNQRADAKQQMRTVIDLI